MADIAHQDVEAVRQALRESLREYSLSQIAPAETSKHNFFFWLENSDNLVVTFREPSGIKVISATTGVVTHEIPVSESSEVRYAYSVDGTDYIILVFVNPFLFKVYSLTSGTFVHEAPLRTDPIPFRVSDKRVYIRQGNEVDVFDLRTLSVVHTFSFPNSVGYLGFSLDSKHVFVCVSGDNLYRIEAGTTTQTKVLSDKPEGWGDYFVYNPQLGVALCRANDVDYDDYSVVSLADSSIKPGLVVKRLLGFGTATSRGLVWVLQGKNSDQLQLLDPSTLDHTSVVTLPKAVSYISSLGDDYILARDDNEDAAIISLNDWSIVKELGLITYWSWSDSLKTLVLARPGEKLEVIVL